MWLVKPGFGNRTLLLQQVKKGKVLLPLSALRARAVGLEGVEDV